MKMQNWEYKKLGDVCDVIAGQSPEGKYYNQEGRGTPFYQGKKDFGDKYLGEPTTWTTVETKIAIENDILMSVRAPVGDINICNSRVCIGRGLAAIRASKNIDEDYLFYFLLSEKPNITGKEGAVFASINRSDIADLDILIPPLEEQKRIVKILDEKFAQLETVKANAKTNLQNAKDLFQSQLTKAFVFPQGNTNTTWEKKTVLEVCTNIVDCPHTTPKKVNNKTDFPCIRTSELKDGFIFWDSMQYLDEEEYKKRVARLQPQENDIVFGREGSVGGAILIPHEFHFSLGQRTMLLRPNQNIIYPKYFLQVIISDFFRKQIREKITPGGVPHINVADVKSLNVLLPPLPEQKRIVEQLDSLSEKTKVLQDIYNKILLDCDELKQAFLSKAFAGEL